MRWRRGETCGLIGLFSASPPRGAPVHLSTTRTRSEIRAKAGCTPLAAASETRKDLHDRRVRTKVHPAGARRCILSVRPDEKSHGARRELCLHLRPQLVGALLGVTPANVLDA